MGTRALLIIDNNDTTGTNTFYAQHGSPAYKIPALTRWMVHAAGTGEELSADNYAAYADGDDADHFTERRDEHHSMASASNEWADSDIEYIYWIGTLPLGNGDYVGHIAVLHKPIGAHTPESIEVEAAVTWTRAEQNDLHDLACQYLREMRVCLQTSADDYRAAALMRAIDNTIDWHHSRRLSLTQ